MRHTVPAPALVLFGALFAGAGAGAVAAVGCGEEWHSSYGDYGDDIGRPSSTVAVDASRPDSGHKTAAPQVGPGDAAPADAPSAADAADGATDAAQD